MLVEVHRNRRAGLWSVVDPASRRVIAQRTHALVAEAQLVVQPASQRALVRGRLVEDEGPSASREGWCRLRYAPAVEDAFLVGYTPVTRADLVEMDEAGDLWAIRPV